MILIETHPGRWAVRDNRNAPARAIITETDSHGGPPFRADEWHIVPSDRHLIGEFDSLRSAFAGVMEHVARSHRLRSSA